MAKAFLFGPTREDGLVVVSRTVHARPGTELEDEKFPDGYAFEGMPDYPDYKRGVEHVALFDPRTGKFSFEEKERPLTQEESLQELAEQIGELVKEMRASRAEKDQRSP